MDLDTSIAYLKGVGPRRAKVLENKGIRTVEDLLYYLPFRYEDRTNVKPVSNLVPGETAAVLGTVVATQQYGSRMSKWRIFEVRVRDEFGDIVVGKWFRGGYLQSLFERGQTVALYGKIEIDDDQRSIAPYELSIVHPDYEILSSDDESESALHVGRVVPVYRAIGKVQKRAIRAMVWHALEAADLDDDPLPEPTRKRLGLPNRKRALSDAHFPPADTDQKTLEAYRTPAQFRLIFEEFFYLEVGLALKRRRAKSVQGIAFELNDRAREQIRKILPFRLTNAQRRVVREIAYDMERETPMNRLLQGDVGSGKTIVAMQAAVIALENGYQVAVMAPTEILAAQHLISFRKLLEPAGYVVVGLTGSYSQREKTKLKRLIREGIAHVAVGTHALISKDVEYKSLGLIVIDEQHRFGVVQRLELLRKGVHPDVLVMTATPIPRTLALTLYGDLDVSIIDELPPGRSPIITRQRTYAQVARVYAFIAQQVAEGRQAYIVCPLVEESELRETKAAVETHERLSTEVFPSLKVGLLHGRMKSAEKEEVMDAFNKGEIQILVSTTVVEVGVDVPNASVMVVEHAESFGLSQLHQLRGRVGRGAAQSYCILLTEDPSATATERIKTMERTQDGFEIADVDLKLRGPGEFFGTKQSGLPEFRVANLLRDKEALELARSEANGLVESGDKETLEPLVAFIQDRWQRRYGLVQVG